MKRKLFLLVPGISAVLALSNLMFNRVFEFFLWFMTTILLALIFFPLAFKTNEKDVPIFQTFAPVLLIPIFFSIFAIMDFMQFEFLSTAQATVYGVTAGVLTIMVLMLVIGPNKY